MRRALAVAMAFAGTVACSFVFDLPASEAPFGAVDGATLDATSDGAVTDAPPTTPPDVEPPPRFCATRSAPFVYCSDFDDTPPPDLASIGTLDVVGGQFALSSAVSLSPPRSLLASIVNGTNASARLSRALGTDPDGVTLSFDMLVSAWTTAGAKLARIELGDATTGCAVGLDGTDTTWTLTQRCTNAGVETAALTTTSTSAIARGRWQRFALAVRFAPTANVSLDVDGTRVADVAGVAPLARAQTAIVLGTALLPSGTVSTFQDNVLVTSP